MLDLSKTTEEALTGVPKARAHLDEVIADIRKKNNDLITAASLTTPQELLEIGGRIDQELAKVRKMAATNLADAGNKKALDDSLANVDKYVRAFLSPFSYDLGCSSN